MTSYTVIRAESIASLVQSVNEACREGWHPLGGLVVIEDHTVSNGIAPVFYQAMVQEGQIDADQFEKRVRQVLKNELGMRI